MNPIGSDAAEMAVDAAKLIGCLYKYITVTFMENGAYIAAQKGNDWLNVRIFEGDPFEERVYCHLGTYQMQDGEPVNQKELLADGDFKELLEALYRFLEKEQAACTAPWKKRKPSLNTSKTPRRHSSP